MLPGPWRPSTTWQRQTSLCHGPPTDVAEPAAAAPQRQVDVVTGSSSGIGEAVARRLARRGHPCGARGRREERLEWVVAQIRSPAEGLDPNYWTLTILFRPSLGGCHATQWYRHQPRWSKRCLQPPDFAALQGHPERACGTDRAASPAVGGSWRRSSGPRLAAHGASPRVGTAFAPLVSDSVGTLVRHWDRWSAQRVRGLRAAVRVATYRPATAARLFRDLSCAGRGAHQREHARLHIRSPAGQQIGRAPLTVGGRWSPEREIATPRFRLRGGCRGRSCGRRVTGRTRQNRLGRPGRWWEVVAENGITGR